MFALINDSLRPDECEDVILHKSNKDVAVDQGNLIRMKNDQMAEQVYGNDDTPHFRFSIFRQKCIAQ